MTSNSFADPETFLLNEQFRQSLCTRYGIPEYFWTEACQRSNGFFGCQDMYDEAQRSRIHSINIPSSWEAWILTHSGSTDTWFRFLVKQLRDSKSLRHHEYEWYEMGFFTTWMSTGSQLVFCFNLPRILHARLQMIFLSPSSPKLPDIYSLHAVIVDEIIKLFDKSVWSLRDVIRKIEMVRLDSYPLRTQTATKRTYFRIDLT